MAHDGKFCLSRQPVFCWVPLATSCRRQTCFSSSSAHSSQLRLLERWRAPLLPLSAKGSCIRNLPNPSSHLCYGAASRCLTSWLAFSAWHTGKRSIVGLAEPMVSLSVFTDWLSSSNGNGRGTSGMVRIIPKTPSAAPAACIPDLWVAPGKAMMQAQCKIQVHHHLSVFGFGLAFY